MPLCPPEDQPVVVAASREVLNIMHYRGLSMNQTVQALVAISASFLWAASTHDQHPLLHDVMLEKNLDMFCKQVRMRARNNLPKKKPRRKEGKRR